MKKGFVILTLLLSFGILDIRSGFSQGNIPLPPDIEIVPPSSELPREVAAFSGRWAGIWEGELESILIVEEIDHQKAKVVYAWGDAPKWRTVKGYYRYVAQVTQTPKAKIEFGGGGGPKFIFEMEKELKSIKGYYEFRDRLSKITMKRLEN